MSGRGSQACRGDENDVPVKLEHSSDVSHRSQDFVMNSHDIPTEPDFLFGRSCPHGFLSWRNPTTGSWFVQTLCDVLEKCSDSVDLLALLTITTGKIAVQNIPNETDIGDEAKSWLNSAQQVPSTTSTLTKDLYLKRRIDLVCSVDNI